MSLKSSNSCRICGHRIEAFMSFGRMPIANGFLTGDQIASEFYFELAPAFCDRCGMFQIVEQPPPEKMFHENYAFFASTSRYMQAHFQRFAQLVTDRYLAGRSDPFIVELGSNDGIMLRNFKSLGYRHLGIEPSSNVASVARQQGVETLIAFFDEELADAIVEEHGHADAVLAANVMCHIPNLSSVAGGIQRLLKPDGVLLFEDPYLGDMVAKTSYDQIYDEHIFIFSAMSVARAFEPFGLELIDVIPQVTHGGSMRYVLSAKGNHPASANVAQLLATERAQGLGSLETFHRFRANCETSRDRLKETLEDIHSRGKRVAGYGATSKSTTVVNYCGIGPDLVEFISDTTPIKHGKLSPGAHIPVRPYQDFVDNYPDYALLFAWNHAAEIREKESNFIAAGGRWIVYVPKVDIIS
jgi:methylation protein EvaC